MNRGFTLLELIVVIVIIGILATLGFSQYTKTVEKVRGAEARANLGLCRKLAIEYYFKNGACTGISNDDLNIGTGSNQLPSACISTFYFSYSISGEYTNPGYMIVHAWRCNSGGKPPQGSGDKGIALFISMDGSGVYGWQDGQWIGWTSTGGVGGNTVF